MNILNIFADKLDLSPDEHRDMKTWIVDLDTQRKQVDSITNVGGGGPSLATGNVEIDFAAGITLKNPTTGARSIFLDPDGDAWFGKDIDSFENNTLFVISNDQRWDGQTYGEGDLLIGSHRTGKANIWWDASVGKLYFRNGTTVSGYIGGGNIVFQAGTIGGWTISATKLSSTNIDLDSSNSTITAGSIVLDGTNDDLSIGTGLVFDGATEVLTVGAGASYLVVDGGNTVIKSSNYSADASGFAIFGVDGDAEFNNIKARGRFQTAVFEYQSVSAIGGSLLLSKNAGEVDEAVSTDTTFTLKVKTADDGTALVAVGDILRIKYWNGTEIIDVWVTAGAVSTAGGVSSFTATLQSGGTGKSIQKGAAVVNYGQSGDGIMQLQAGSTSTRLRIATHAGSPWTTETNQVVLGNLRGTFGADANDYYGIGLGDYSTGNYLSYNADGSSTFVVKGGDGGITYDDSGLSIDVAASDVWATKAGIRWLDGTDIRARLWAYDNGTNSVFKLENDQGGTGGSGGMNTTILMHSDAGYLKQGKITLRASSDNIDNSSSLELMNDDAGDDYAQLSTNGWVELLGSGTHVGTGGLFVGASGSRPSSLTEGAITSTGNVTVGKTLHVTGVSVPSSGVGIEMYWNGSASRVLSYSRTGGTYQPLDFISSKFQFLEGTTNVITIDNGDIWTQDFTNYSSSTTVGWSSLSTKKIYYKTIGDWVFIQFELYGTANNATTTFTVPYSNNGSIQAEGVMRGDDNAGAAQFGMCILPTSSNVVTLYRNPALTAWSASGTKWASGQFWYQRA